MPCQPRFPFCSACTLTRVSESDEGLRDGAAEEHAQGAAGEGQRGQGRALSGRDGRGSRGEEGEGCGAQLPRSSTYRWVRGGSWEEFRGD